MSNTYMEDIQFFNPVFKVFYFIAVLILASLLLKSSSVEPVLFIPIALLFGIPLLFGKMTITVADGSLLVSYGYINLIKKKIRLSDIIGAEKVKFRPIRDFGGWGIRCGKFNGERTGCYNLKGNTGVLLNLSCDTRVCIGKTKRVIIGSQKPDILIEMINLHSNAGISNLPG